MRLDLVKSWLQKAIRQGKCEEALTAAGEIALMQWAPEPSKVPLYTNFLHRLQVIFLEDVGLGGLGLWPAMDKDFSALFQARAKPWEARDLRAEAGIIERIIRAMCASERGRCASHARAITKADTNTEVLLRREEFAGIAALHNDVRVAEEAAGVTCASRTPQALEFWCAQLLTALKSRCWTAVFWASRLACIEDMKVSWKPSCEAMKPHKRRTKPVWMVFNTLGRLGGAVQTLVALGATWHAEYIGTMREAFLCWMNIVIAVVVGAEVGLESGGRSESPPGSPSGDMWRENRERGGVPFAVPQDAVDKHTAAGRRDAKRKTATFFAKVGAAVTNETRYVQADHARFYIALKELEDEHGMGTGTGTGTGTSSRKKLKISHDGDDEEEKGPMEAALETDAYRLHVRAQLNTCTFKSDVYFATSNLTKEFVVVKGPLPRGHAANPKSALDMAAWKRTHGLPYVDVAVVYLVPDRWPQGVPLGVRNVTDRARPAPFLVSASVVPIEDVGIRVHSSEKWPATEVAVCRCPLHVTFPLTQTEMVDYVRALLARFVFGIADLADRNFLRTGGRVISIDEDTRRDSPDIVFGTALSKARCRLILEWLEVVENYGTLKVQDWTFPASCKDRFARICDFDACKALFG
jgi:hypothetical protein